MLFNSFAFIFCFLPIVLGSFWVVQTYWGMRWACVLLVLFSWFFYGWWNPSYLGLLLGSIGINFLIGQPIGHQQRPRTVRLVWLWFGIVLNLALIGYYKYAGFFAGIYADIMGQPATLIDVVLPLAISFFTFQQIAYLVDQYRDGDAGYSLGDYCLFVSFFPQLIAGPIVHHHEMMPQFQHFERNSEYWQKVAIGVTLFVIGLVKKVLFADTVAVYVAPVFDAVNAGQTVSMIEAWGGALAYTCQLYFDFSGYSDMAIGLALMFGIVLPINFNSPYKSQSIIVFWRRWHMTLSRFLRDYVYIAFGGSHHGRGCTYLNLLLTMLLGGLWHGAAWTFVFWGGLHGVYLLLNHAWQGTALRARCKTDGMLYKSSALLLTFVAVVIAWVFFRAETLQDASSIVASMAGMHGVMLPNALQSLAPLLNSVPLVTFSFGSMPYFFGGEQILTMAVLFIIIFLMPNSYQLMSRYVHYRDVVIPKWTLKLGMTTAYLTGFVLFAVALAMSSAHKTEFLYFNF